MVGNEADNVAKIGNDRFAQASLVLTFHQVSS